MEGVGKVDNTTALLAKWNDLTETEINQFLNQLTKTELKVTNSVTKSAKSANMEFNLDYLNRICDTNGNIIDPQNFRPPYAKGSFIIESELTQDAIFIKLYSDDRFKAGQWLMSIEDFKTLNMDAAKLKDVFALPSKPLKYALVKVPKGIKICEGTASKIWDDTFKWGNGGGKQYQIMDWENIDPLKKTKWFQKGGNL